MCSPLRTRAALQIQGYASVNLGDRRQGWESEWGKPQTNDRRVVTQRIKFDVVNYGFACEKACANRIAPDNPITNLSK